MAFRDARLNGNYRRDNLQDNTGQRIVSYNIVRPVRFARNNLGITTVKPDLNTHHTTRLLRSNLGVSTGGGGGITGPGSTDPYAAQKVFNVYQENPLPLDVWIDSFIITYSQIGLDPTNHLLHCSAAGNIGYLGYSESNSSPYGNLSNILALGSTFTIEAVISSASWYIGSAYFSGVICAKRQSTTADYEIALYNGLLYFFYTTDGVTFQSLTWTFSPANNTVYYLVIQRNGTSIDFYINGISQGSQTLTATFSNQAYQFLLFGDSLNPTNPFNIHAFRMTKALRPVTSTYPVYLSTVNC